jgi:DNA helicase II / ATP-dependent DNA helicase PcrA
MHSRRPSAASRRSGRPVHFVAADERSEAAYIASEIVHLKDEGTVDDLGDVAVLYRTNRQAQELIVALRERRQPYRVLGGGDLLTRRAVRDAVAYLRLALNPGDMAALSRIVNVPPRRLECLAEAMRGRPCGVDQLAALADRYGPATRQSAADLAELIRTLHEQVRHLPPDRLLDLVLEQSGYRAWIASTADGDAHLRWLAELLRLAKRAEFGLADWLAELQLGEEPEASADDAGRVVLTTIHGAKGGEWSVVFVTGVEEGLLPHFRAAAVLPSGGPETRPSQEAGVQDELRVAYVAVTRPRDRLYLTSCRQRRMGDRIEPRAQSRFLRDIPAELLTRAA